MWPTLTWWLRPRRAAARSKLLTMLAGDQSEPPRILCRLFRVSKAAFA